MRIEVEQKFRVNDLPALERQLADLGQSEPRRVVQEDAYFAHPARDFAKTDEALRLRRVGELYYITYKGPKLNTTSKTRQEIELSVSDGKETAASAVSLLEALSFRRVANVHKRRDASTLRWQNREVDVAFDQIDELGDFVELEIVTDERGLAAAHDCIASLAGRLGLTQPERRSYLELLLEHRQRTEPAEVPAK